MKQLLLTSTMFVTLTAGAMAADLPVRAAPPAPVIAAPVFTWSGFYAGVNIGAGFDVGDDTNGRLRATSRAPTPQGIVGTTVPVTPQAGGTFFRDNDTGAGVLGGGQVGYNMQFGSFVVGIEADAQAMDLGRNDRLPRFGTANIFVSPGQGPLTVYDVQPGAQGNVVFFDRSQLEAFGTVRGRAGMAFDRTLLYVTGGLAWGIWDDARPNLPGPGFFVNNLLSPNANYRRAQRNAARADQDEIGWTVGAGLEYAFTNNISAKIEGLYVKIDGRNNPVVGVTNTGVRIREIGGRDNAGEFALVRAGLNFRFGSW